MRRAQLALAIALAAAASAPGAENGLGMVDEAWTKAILAADLEALAALYASDAVLYPPDSMQLKGGMAIRKGYENLFSRMKVLDAKLVPERYETEGDTSYGWGHWSMKIAPKAGGLSVRTEGRYMAVARKVGGRWLYVAGHASIPPPKK